MSVHTLHCAQRPRAAFFCFNHVARHDCMRCTARVEGSIDRSTVLCSIQETRARTSNSHCFGELSVLNGPAARWQCATVCHLAYWPPLLVSIAGQGFRQVSHTIPHILTPRSPRTHLLCVPDPGPGNSGFRLCARHVKTAGARLKLGHHEESPAAHRPPPGETIAARAGASSALRPPKTAIMGTSGRPMPVGGCRPAARHSSGACSLGPAKRCAPRSGR